VKGRTRDHLGTQTGHDWRERGTVGGGVAKNRTWGVEKKGWENDSLVGGGREKFASREKKTDGKSKRCLHSRWGGRKASHDHGTSETKRFLISHEIAISRPILSHPLKGSSRNGEKQEGKG